MARGKSPSPEWKLYWCETDDHDEDWFIVARDDEEAARWHENAEGYNERDATAELVCLLPRSLQCSAELGWPSDELLIACGGEFLPVRRQDGADEFRAAMGSFGRVVRIRDRVYGEGDLIGNMLHRSGKLPRS